MPLTSPSNHLIALMTPRRRRRFSADLRVVDIAADERLSIPGSKLTSVSFPTGAVISVLCHSKGRTMDVRGVGCEGMLGSDGLMAAERRFELVCQISGTVLQMPVSTFRRHASESAPLRGLMSTYSAGVLTLTAQSVACNALHTIAQQCARWLLITDDRAGRREFTLTHELLARMIGAQRSGVSIAVARLQAQGHIRYRSGRVRVIDREGLESASCDCYDAVVLETERLFRRSAKRRVKTPPR